jgi:predicted phage terminase large subunit-like protein
VDPQQVAQLLPYLDPGQRAELDAVLAAPDPVTFHEYIDLVTAGPSGQRYYLWTKLHQVLADVLQLVVDGHIQRLMVFMPPRHGKSEQVSRLLPAYYLYRHPRRWCGITSYAADLAHGFSRNARANYLRGGGALNPAAQAVGTWETMQGGGLWAAGYGGGITGKGFHLGVIDDPIKNKEEAESKIVRERQKGWYSTTWHTRREPDAAEIVMMTRWHMDDLAGHLLEQIRQLGTEPWHVLDLPAYLEDHHVEAYYPASCTVLPDWRTVGDGQAVCPERYPPKVLDSQRASMTAYEWSALYAQRPRPPEGAMFKRPWFTVVPILPLAAVEGGRYVRYWDRAATPGGGDYTAGVLVCKGGDGHAYVVDVVRGRWASGERDKVYAATVQGDGHDVAQWVEQEPGSSGVDAVVAAQRLVPGYSVRGDKVTGAKEQRWDPLASWAEVQGLRLVAGPWVNDFVQELCNAPHGANDDQLDAAAGGFIKLGGRVLPTLPVVRWST